VDERLGISEDKAMNLLISAFFAILPYGFSCVRHIASSNEFARQLAALVELTENYETNYKAIFGRGSGDFGVRF